MGGNCTKNAELLKGEGLMCWAKSAQGDGRPCEAAKEKSMKLFYRQMVGDVLIAHDIKPIIYLSLAIVTTST